MSIVLEQRAVDRVWSRNEARIRSTIVFQLYMKFRNVPSVSEEHVLSITMDIFFRMFYEKYETDNQYLSYLFISVKNSMLSFIKKEIKYQHNHLRQHVLKDPQARDEYPHGDIDPSDFMLRDEATREPTFQAVKDNDLIRRIEELLGDDFHIEVFRMILHGAKIIEIANHFEIPTNTITEIKKRYIWPATKDALDVPDKVYEVLTCSGRIV